MHKRQFLPIVLILALILSACGVQPTASGRLPDEPYEAVPYNLYPIPEGNYNIGDTVHFNFDGKVAHVFSKETDKNLEF